MVEMEKELTEAGTSDRDAKRWSKPDQRRSRRRRNVNAIVSKWTGIPISKLIEGEKEKLMHMEQRLKEPLSVRMKRLKRFPTLCVVRAGHRAIRDGLLEVFFSSSYRCGQDRTRQALGGISFRHRRSHGPNRHERVHGTTLRREAHQGALRAMWAMKKADVSPKRSIAGLTRSFFSMKSKGTSRCIQCALASAR